MGHWGVPSQLPSSFLQRYSLGTIAPGTSRGKTRMEMVVACIHRPKLSPKLIPCCLCNNWCHVPCSYQTHLGRICPCHVILDPRRKIMVISHPYMEDYAVLPTRPVIRADDGKIDHDISYELAHEDLTMVPLEACVQRSPDIAVTRSHIRL